MNSNIFNIEQEYLDIINQVEANDGELTPELEEALTINAENRDAKMRNYVYVIKQKEADVNMVKDEITRLREVSTRSVKLVDKLKSTIVKALELFDLRNKAGNLYYSLGDITLTTRRTESVIPKIEDFDIADEVLYEDYLDFVIKTKLTKSQLDRITNILREDGNPSITYDVDLSKSKFKEAYKSLDTIQDEIEKEVKEELLNRLAVIEEGISLSIR